MDIPKDLTDNFGSKHCFLAEGKIFKPGTRQAKRNHYDVSLKNIIGVAKNYNIGFF